MLVIAFLIEGQFHIHRAGCDCPEALPDDGRSRAFVAECYEDVARHCYRQFLDDDMHMGEALDCLAFARCTTGLTYEALMTLSIHQAGPSLSRYPGKIAA